ncbi:MAG: glycosyltransferase family 39 protein [Candidatus Daviesbacteria bacterium]|nr:glycosyltransferase family 39 protein [Candidatus Daviesbacteria bacterium]
MISKENINRLFAYKADIISVLLLTLTLPLFFYNLGQTSLGSWDEAWYAEIAKNIIRTGDFLNLTWNGSPYYDHPPFGFWLIAISMKIFGFSEFWVRFPSALVGFMGIIATYFLGKELFNRVVGFSSALALASSFWFIYRARSGNLDVFLTVLFISTILFALKAAKSKYYLVPFVITISALFLTKTLIPFTIIPSILLIFWKSKYSLKELIAPVVSFLIIVGGWVIIQMINNPAFLTRYFSIGMPGVQIKTSYLDNLKLSKEYLHNGIGKWFWPGFFSVLGTTFLFQKRFYILIIFITIFYIPFIFSSKGHIWHLVPLYPFMIMVFFGFIFVVLERVVRVKNIIYVIIFSIALYTSLIQIRQLWYQFIDISAYTSDEEILSAKAGGFTEDFFIDENFGPAAVFYSGKNVTKVGNPNLQDFFNEQKSFILITTKNRLDQADISGPQYRIIAKDRDKILILKQDE